MKPQDQAPQAPAGPLEAVVMPDPAECERLYYRTAARQRTENPCPKPPWVPTRVRLPREVRGDWPFGRELVAPPGDHDSTCNQYGAVCVVAANGKPLGLKLDEFEPIAWGPNLKA